MSDQQLLEEIRDGIDPSHTNMYFDIAMSALRALAERLAGLRHEVEAVRAAKLQHKKDNASLVEQNLELRQEITDLRAAHVESERQFSEKCDEVVAAEERAEAAEKRLAEAIEALKDEIEMRDQAAKTIGEAMSMWDSGLPHEELEEHDFGGYLYAAHSDLADGETLEEILARLAAPQKEAVKPPKELPPMWESTDGGYSKESGA